jgi:hypothetical protein
VPRPSRPPRAHPSLPHGFGRRLAGLPHHGAELLLTLDVYEQLQRAMAYDASEPDPRDFDPAFAEAVKDDIDAPGVERFDDEALPRTQP